MNCNSIFFVYFYQDSKNNTFAFIMRKVKYGFIFTALTFYINKHSSCKYNQTIIKYKQRK